LPVWKVFAGAFRLCWKHRKPLARVIAAPLLLVAAVGLIGESGLIAHSGALQWLLVLGNLVPTAWLAVNVHRFLLSDLTTAQPEADSRNWKRLALYALALLALWLSFFVAVPIVAPVEAAMTAMYSADNAVDLEQAMTTVLQAALLGLIVSMIAALLAGRLCLVLPAIAVDGDVRAAIYAARGNTIRLAVIFSLLSVALPLPAQLLMSEDPGFMGAALLVLLGAVVMVVEVAALSLAYRELTAHAPPPTDPPA
jgi:ABC-type Fe3+ transport system permease subunit